VPVIIWHEAEKGELLLPSKDYSASNLEIKIHLLCRRQIAFLASGELHNSAVKFLKYDNCRIRQGFNQ
jgi:hypothetical protein